MLERLGEIQIALRDRELTGWLLVSHAGQNPIAERLLRVDGKVCKRRWFYYLPADGIPALVAQRTEMGRFPQLPGEREPYGSWPELRDALARVLPPKGEVAMEYVPMGVNAELSRVDAGTIELVQSYGVTVVSSADLVQTFLGRLTDLEIDAQREVALKLCAILEDALDEIDARLGRGEAIDEGSIERTLEARVRAAGLAFFDAYVASGPSTADPTHRPSATDPRSVGPGELLELAIAAAVSEDAHAIAEATRVAYVGDDVPEQLATTFDALSRARDRALGLVRERASKGRRIHGFEVDRAARDVLVGAGLGDRALHRMGHHLARGSRGAEACALDSFEMHETRALEPGHAWSLHPAVYFDDWGMRTTTCFHLGPEGLVVSSVLQNEIRVVGKKLAK
jgi:Xaa-Pro aminopeptidase